MSHEVMTLAGLSAHPALVESHRNRAVLIRLANRADPDGGSIRPSIPNLADLMAGGRPNTGDAYRDEKIRETRQRKLREAITELERAGILSKTGEVYGEPGKEVPVRRIDVDALALYTDPEECGVWLVKAYPDAAFGGQGCPPRAGVPTTGRGASEGQVRGAPQGQGSPAPHGQPNQSFNQSMNQSPKTEIATGPIEPNQPPRFETEPDHPDPPRGGKWIRPEEMPRDGLLVAMAAKRRAKAAALAALPLPGIEAEPEAPPPPKVSPGEARVAAAVVVALEAIGTAGVPERTLKLWRAKIDTRLRDDGVAEEKVSARLDAIRAAWGNLQRSTWHIENGRADRAHFFKVTLRSGQELDTMASKRNGQPRVAQSRWSKGGQHYGRPEDAFNEAVPF